MHHQNTWLLDVIGCTDVGTAVPHPQTYFDEARTGSSEMLAAYKWGYIWGYI